MKRVIVLLACVFAISEAISAQTLTGTNHWTGTNTFPNVNNIIYVDGTKNLTLQDALNALPAPCTGGLIIIPMSLTFTSPITITCPAVTIQCLGSDQTTTNGVVLTYDPTSSGTAAITASSHGSSFHLRGCTLAQGNTTGSTNGLVFQGSQNSTLEGSHVTKFTGTGFEITDLADPNGASGIYNLCANALVDYNGTGLLLSQTASGKAVNQNVFLNCSFVHNSVIQIKAVGNVSENQWTGLDISGLTSPLVQLGDLTNFCRDNIMTAVTMEADPLPAPTNQTGIQNNCQGTYVHTEGALGATGDKPIVDGCNISSCSHIYIQGSWSGVGHIYYESTLPVYDLAALGQATGGNWAGVATLSGGTTTVAFAHGGFYSTPICVGADQTAANPVALSATATQLVISGHSSDQVAWMCIGNPN
jgi:hypothetical protein